MVYHSTFVVFLSRDTLKKLSLKRKFCPRFRRGMGSFKEILMPKTIVFGKGELVFFLFHALRVAVGVDPYEHAPGEWRTKRVRNKDFRSVAVAFLFSSFKGKVFGERAGLRVAVGVDPYEYASCQWDQRCTQQDFSVGYGGFPFPSMSVGDDAHGVPLNQLPFSEERDTASFSFLFQRKSFWGESLREGLFCGKSLSHKKLFRYPK